VSCVLLPTQYIRCQACEALVKQAYRHIKTKRAALKPGHKVRVCVCGLWLGQPAWQAGVCVCVCVRVCVRACVRVCVFVRGCVRRLVCARGSAARGPLCTASPPRVLTHARMPPLPMAPAHGHPPTRPQLQESEIIEYLETMCDTSKPDGARAYVCGGKEGGWRKRRAAVCSVAATMGHPLSPDVSASLTPPDTTFLTPHRPVDLTL
jgi:hypothetical protein